MPRQLSSRIKSWWCPVPSLSPTPCRVHRVSIRGDISSGISSGAENSAMVARGVAEVEDMDVIVVVI